MRYIEALQEKYVVAHFLKHEMKSDRFQEAIFKCLRQNDLTTLLLEQPDLENAEECFQRAKVLGEFRGYQQKRGLFEDFPNDVNWARFAISTQELMRVRYVDYSYWNDLSGGSRLPADAAIRIQEGATVYGMSTQPFLQMAEALGKGITFPELILVGTKEDSELVVVEGHARLTAYALKVNLIPENLTAIVGLSPAMSNWL